MLAISVDPAHDTPSSAKAFVAREQLTGRMRFLLGRFTQLRPLWKQYAIQPEFNPSERRYPYGYSAYVMLIDRRGFLQVGFPPLSSYPKTSLMTLDCSSPAAGSAPTSGWIPHQRWRASLTHASRMHEPPRWRRKSRLPRHRSRGRTRSATRSYPL